MTGLGRHAVIGTDELTRDALGLALTARIDHDFLVAVFAAQRGLEGSLDPTATEQVTELVVGVVGGVPRVELLRPDFIQVAGDVRE